MKGNGEHRCPTSIPAFSAFIPFGIILIRYFHPIMTLRWVSLVIILESASFLSIYLNIMANDLTWTVFGIWAFIVICTPVYLNAIKAQSVMSIEKSCDKITFASLFKMCSYSVFSDYRISLTAKIPLVIQVVVGGSLLYEVFGADWVIHGLAGFGIGTIALKAYRTAVDNYGYSDLVSYFHLNRFGISGVEKQTGSFGFTLFSVLVVALIWEIFEGVVYLVSPVNVFRIGMEPAWNTIGDVVFGVTSGMAAWYLLKYKLKWL